MFCRHVPHTISALDDQQVIDALTPQRNRCGKAAETGPMITTRATDGGSATAPDGEVSAA